MVHLIGNAVSSSILRGLIGIGLITFAFVGSVEAQGLSQRMESIIRWHTSLIEQWAVEPILVDATKAQNADNRSLSEIQVIDQQWLAGKTQAFAESLQNNPAGLFLKEKVLSNPRVYAEAFLCDRQGAVVGEFPQTSDYWQGDEEKFSNSFAEGDGVIYRGPLQFDESTQSYAVQISVPVKDQSQTIGVLIVGIRNIQ